jgi:adenine phosphoribosyltransferase
MPENIVKNLIRTIPDFPQKGVMFKDISPIFLHPAVCEQIVEKLASESLQFGSIQAVAAIESRGFLLGILLAQKMGVPFHMIRKKGKLPGETVQETYQLEYGNATIEIHKGFIQPGEKVLIHDDVLATGGTAAAAAKLIEKEGGNVAGFAFLIELTFLKGREVLSNINAPIYSLLKY